MKMLFWSLSVVFGFSVFGASHQDFDFEKAWKKVEELRSKGLPKSAMEEVDIIFAEAQKEKEVVQMVKAIKVKSELWIETDENGINNAIELLETQRKNLPGPANNIIASYLAEIYHQYFQSNRYVISQISHTKDRNTTDFKEWSSQDFYEHILELYRASLSGNNLEDETEKFSELLVNKENFDKNIRPTLYTLLWDRVHVYLQEMSGNVNLSLESQYLIKDPAFLGDVNSFLAISLKDTIKEDPSYFILQGYQKVLRHVKNQNSKSLADYDLGRLQFVYRNSTIYQKDSLYEGALRKMMVSYQSEEYVTMMYNALAEYLLKINKPAEALDICKKGIDLYKESPGAIACKNTAELILKKEANISTEEVFASSESPRFALDYKNVKDIQISVYRIVAQDRSGQYHNTKEMYEKMKAGAQKVYDKKWSLPENKMYQMNQIEGELPKFPLGTYMVEISGLESTTKTTLLNYAIFYVSDLAFTGLRNQNQITYRVVDRMEGKPIKGVKVTMYQMEYDDRVRSPKSRVLVEKITDSNGIVVMNVQNNKRVQVVVQKGKDRLDLENDMYHYFNPEREEEHKFAEIFTDRAIYRPGQTVHFKAIALRTNGKGTNEIIKEIPLTVSLFDANYQEVSKVVLTTNDFGSVAGSFTLPTGLLTGQFYLNIQSKKGVSGQKYFRVEEYKRPKFEIVIDTFKDAYLVNKNISVSGAVHNYAGNPLDDAEIEYKVIRGSRFIDWGWWWRPAPGYDRSERVIALGSTKSDKNGKFSFEFLAIPNESIPESDQPIFDFRIEITAKDVTGESHTKETVVSAGYKALLLKAQLEANVDLGLLQPFFISATNLLGIPQQATGSIKIEKLVEPKNLLLQKYWNESDRPVYIQELQDKGTIMPIPKENRYDRWAIEKVVYANVFQTQTPVNGNVFTEAGVYKITLDAKDVFGNSIQTVSYHVITNVGKKRFPKTKALHVIHHDKMVEPGGKTSFDFGTSEKPVYMVFMAEKDGKILFNESIRVKNLFKFSFPITESHRGGVYFHLHYIYHNRQTSESYFVDVPFTNKQLDIRLETFRDKIYPGTQEEYSFLISGHKKDAVLAELMTTMYDASLESFEVNLWRHQFYNSGYSRLNYEIFGFQSVYNTVVNYDWNQTGYEGNVYYMYPALMGIQIYQYGSPVMYKGRMYGEEVIMESRSNKARDMAEAAPAANGEGGVEQQSSGEDTKPKAEDSPPAIRKNLSESVFFYPQLKTDASGNVKISFTMNEALTKWKMMSLVHTQDMKVGYDERYVQTYKKLMIFPNPPRFLRTSDKLVLTAKVSNTTVEKIRANVRMTLVDVLSGEDVTSRFLKVGGQKEVSLPAEGSMGLEWEISVPDDFVNTLAWTVVAETEGHSDGEENIIPVLTNQVLITETLPIFVNGKQKKVVNFASFIQNTSKTKVDKNFTFEYTSHPVWYVVQALPYLAEQGFENTEHIVNRFFANSISSKIAHSNPKISKVFDQWRLYEKDALASKLTSNEALKSALLEETPWVVNAMKEEEQKRNIALLFEVNNLKNELASTLKKLKERQMANGSFPWFVNGRSDLYITQYIIETLGQMVNLGAIEMKNPEIAEVVQKAMKYIDSETLYWYNKNKESQTSSGGKMIFPPVHYLGFHYLYVRSFFPEIALPKENEEVYQYYFKKAKEEWLQQNLYTQILIGIVMKRVNDPLATAIYKSFEERSFEKEEMGKYWNVGNGYRWDELPIERQSHMIEFYHEMVAGKDDINAMKLWLLKNKQTRHWPTTKSTASAIYGILLEGETGGPISWIEEKEPVSIMLGTQKLTFEKVEAGTGYVKKTWTDQVFPKEWGTITLDNPNTSTSWGAAYYQYFENMDNVKAHSGNPLKVFKTLYLVRQTNKGEVLEEVSNQNTLHPGDKLTVRLKLVTDRSMDYVHLKDARASGFEPMSTLSGYNYKGSLYYYENIKDLASHFYISHLPKGEHIIEYNLRVVHKGTYTGGLATLQSMYAPEFASHSKGMKLKVE